MRALGATVRCADLWDDPAAAVPRAGESVRAILIEAMGRPDLAAAALRALRRAPALRGVGALVAVCHGQVAQLDPAAGFDDFVLIPYVPAELYARVRNVEWRLSEFSNEERMKIGTVVIDRLGHQVTVGGKLVSLTARELGLLIHLCERRGRVVSRDQALASVWGDDYEGGARTVDIHVRRLRQKLGEALPLSTVRGVGYKIATPEDLPGEVLDG
ncbi:MAG: response regulator transcription factor [Deltaproteobacteria bacterium]|nr:response regulator transcription factor [Deltaproteobacteria bacterium]